jgi:hypothetical protein
VGATGRLQHFPIYPKDLTAAEIDAAGEAAFKSALRRDAGTKLDPIGTMQKADGSPADGFFEATVRAGDPPRDVKIQGWYKKSPDGTDMITSHAPACKKDWPTIPEESYQDAGLRPSASAWMKPW